MKHNRNERNSCSASTLLWTWVPTLLWSLINTIATCFGHHREFNETWAMCRWLIDGHHREGRSPRKVKTTLNCLQALDSHQFIQYHLNPQARPSHAEKEDSLEPRQSEKRLICIRQEKKSNYLQKQSGISMYEQMWLFCLQSVPRTSDIFIFTSK